MYENSVSMYVLILSTVHQIDAPKINFFTQSHKKNNRAQALFAVTEDSELRRFSSRDFTVEITDKLRKFGEIRDVGLCIWMCYRVSANYL